MVTSGNMCRTANGHDINFLEDYKGKIQDILEKGETKFEDLYTSAVLKDGRGNICPVTIILPTLAMEARKAAENSNENPDEAKFSRFMKILETKISEAKDMLIERYNYIASQKPESARFMYENHIMAGYEENKGIESALQHGTLSLGQIGIAETLEILVGTDQTTKKGMYYAKQIEQLFKDKCAEYKDKYRLNFGVYFTPAESLCYTAFNKWKEKYGDYENVTYYYDKNGKKKEKLYFTNSMHVPVYKEISPFEKIDIESQLTGYSSAGCITYIEVEHEIGDNIEALEKMVDYAMEKDIPYFAVNLPNDSCKCGYQGKIGEVCPKCGSSEISRLRRVTGYLTGDYKSAFNKGKQVETEQRCIHNKKIEL